MTEVGSSKVYTYDFAEIPNLDYIYVATVTGYSDMSWTIYRDQMIGGFGGGWFSIDYGIINSHTSRKVNELKEQIAKIPKTDLSEIGTKLDEIESQNEIAKDKIIDTIKSSENEVCSDIIRKNKEIKEDNISTRNLIRQKTKKIDENVSKLADRQDLTDKMIESEADEIEEEIKKIYEKEADDMGNELQSIYAKEYDQIEKETNQSNNGNT